MKVRVPFGKLLLVAGFAATALAVPTAAAASPAPDITDSATDSATSGVGIQVVNGRPASEEYPFLVYSSGCTASLIKADWVVTARHCPTPASVRVGSTDRLSGGVVVRVISAVNHPSIDVKLLRLANPVAYAPAPIPAEVSPVGTETRIIGWGQTCPSPGACGAPTIANEVDTSVLADTRCIGINGPFEICTDNTNGVSGACYGDSGGPQVIKVNGGWQLIGATSRSGNNNSICATGPSIYGDLPSIRPWIDTQVGGLPVIEEPVPAAAA